MLLVALAAISACGSGASTSSPDTGGVDRNTTDGSSADRSPDARDEAGSRLPEAGVVPADGPRDAFAGGGDHPDAPLSNDGGADGGNDGPSDAPGDAVGTGADLAARDGSSGPGGSDAGTMACNPLELPPEAKTIGEIFDTIQGNIPTVLRVGSYVLEKAVEPVGLSQATRLPTGKTYRMLLQRAPTTAGVSELRVVYSEDGGPPVRANFRIKGSYIGEFLLDGMSCGNAGAAPFLDTEVFYVYGFDRADPPYRVVLRWPLPGPKQEFTFRRIDLP